MRHLIMKFSAMKHRCLGSILLLLTFAVGAPAAGKLNIVFILADDLVWGELGCYGQRKIPTPNVDRLAAQGMRFTQHYSGAPVCAPSRSVLMTGLHLGHTRVRGNAAPEAAGPQRLKDEDVTVAEVLKRTGYLPVDATQDWLAVVRR
jgi:arylsulfatase A-like enzyme